MAIVLRDILFLLGQAFVFGLLVGCMFKFAIVDTPLAMWSLIGLPIYLAIAALLNYLIYFLLECFIPKTKMAKYPPYQTMRKVLIGIIAVIGTTVFIIAR